MTFSSCTKDETEDLLTPTAQHKLNGEWNLNSISSILPIPSIEDGENVWTIDVENNLLTVVNSSSIEHFELPQSGEYPLTVTTDSLIYGQNGYAFSLQNEELLLSRLTPLDGTLLRLSR